MKDTIQKIYDDLSDRISWVNGLEEEYKYYTNFKVFPLLEQLENELYNAIATCNELLKEV